MQPGGRDSPARVVVVGGGLAGLTAAVGVATAGVRVVLLEASSELGGRARSFVDETTGDRLPIGPHIMMTDYVNLLRLLDVVGGGDVVWQHDEFISLVTGRRTAHLRQAPVPAPFQYVPSLLRDPNTRLIDWVSNTAITLFALSLDEADLVVLDRTSAADLLRRFGVTRRYREQFWSFTSTAILNTPLERCSAGALLRFYRRMVGHRSYLVGFPTDGLGAMFTEPSRRYIELAGGSVHTDEKVTAVCVDDGRVVAIETAAGRRLAADAVILAVPPAGGSPDTAQTDGVPEVRMTGLPDPPPVAVMT